MILNVFTVVGGCLELKRLGQGKFAVSQAQRLLCSSPVLEDISLGERFLPCDKQVQAI